MDSGKENKKNDKVEEPRVGYEIQKPKMQGIDPETFDFDTEFAKGLTPEQAKAESIKRIREWWGNENEKRNSKTFDFEAEFKKGLTPVEFKVEMSKRIQNYPWRK